ncbi:D-xylose reductase [Saitoella coloradoensis]
MVAHVPTVKLAPSGQEMPLVGFGLWKVNNDTCADTVYNAIKHGYRLFDGACDYGNEKEAGEGIRRAIKDGLVKREEIFLTSKLWNTFHAKEHVKTLCKKQLADYGLDYFDLFLIHFPISLQYVDPATAYPPGWSTPEGKTITVDVPIAETWKAMEELVKEGLVKNIGISNFQGSLILDLLRVAEIKPAVLQIEHHPYLTQEALVQLCKQHEIAVTAYSSFGPMSYMELDFESAQKCPPLLEHDIVKKIASAHSKTPAQVLLRWATQRGVAVIPKSNNPERLEQNLDCCSFELTEEEVRQISGLNQGVRFNNPADYLNPPIAIFA